MRPKSEIKLLVEFIFRMTWAFKNKLHEEFKHLEKIEHQKLMLYLKGLASANLFMMYPAGSTRIQNSDPITVETLEVFSLEYNIFTQKFIDLASKDYPETVFTSKIELESGLRVDRITNRIYEIYETQYQAS